jgi:hypothetical protein
MIRSTTLAAAAIASRSQPVPLHEPWVRQTDLPVL